MNAQALGREMLFGREQVPEPSRTCPLRWDGMGAARWDMAGPWRPGALTEEGDHRQGMPNRPVHPIARYARFVCSTQR